MSRRVIRNRNFRTLGYIDTMPDGRRMALDANFRTLGYYDPVRDLTMGPNYRMVARGDILSTIILEAH